MGVVGLSSSDEVRTSCWTCGGTGHLHIPRMGVVTLGVTLSVAMGVPERIGTVGETRHCETCDGEGWISGFVIPM